MARPSATLNTPVSDYAGLEALGNFVFVSMSGNLSFPTPVPTLVSLQTATTAVSAGIAAWGPVGNRGSHSDLLNLRAASLTLRNLLLEMAAYVTSTAGILDAPDYVAMAATIASSGFSVKNAPTPQGLLNAPQNLHQVFKNSVSIYTPKLKWNKPIGLNSPNNVKSYQILRGLTNSPIAAIPIGTSTRTDFTDVTALPATQYFYFVRGVNASGYGNYSNDCQVNTPV